MLSIFWKRGGGGEWWKWVKGPGKLWIIRESWEDIDATYIDCASLPTLQERFAP